MWTLVSTSLLCGIAIGLISWASYFFIRAKSIFISLVILALSLVLGFFGFNKIRKVETNLINSVYPDEIPDLILVPFSPAEKTKFTLAQDKPSCLVGLNGGFILEYKLINPTEQTFAYFVIPAFKDFEKKADLPIWAPPPPLQPQTILDCPEEFFPRGLGKPKSAGKEGFKELLGSNTGNPCFLMPPQSRAVHRLLWREKKAPPVLIIHWYNASKEKAVSGDLEFTVFTLSKTQLYLSLIIGCLAFAGLTYGLLHILLGHLAKRIILKRQGVLPISTPNSRRLIDHGR
jgi:hypothetical protein